MRSVRLGETGLSSSVLGFGCSALLGRSGRRESLRALAAAWDAGITFFDTARSYGYGESESLLGEFLRTRRDRAILATKFGILPSAQPLWKRVAKPVVRGLLSIAPGARGVVRRKTAGEFVPGQFTISILEQSLHESLRRLRTDYVDLLFMHAAPAGVLADGELLGALARLVSAGKVRVAGISCEPDVAALALRQNPPALHAIQFPCNIFDLSAAGSLDDPENSGWAKMANHPFGGAARVQRCREILKEIAASSETPVELRNKLGRVDDAILADVVLNLILQGTGIHVVIPAMMKLTHLRQNVTAIANSRFEPGEIEWLQSIACAWGGREGTNPGQQRGGLASGR